MKINRAGLLSVLQAVSPALAKREIVEQSTSFVFVNGRVLAYDDQIAISHPVDAGLSGAVKADELLKLLSKLKDDEVELETSADELLVRGKRSRAGIRLEAEINLPLGEIAEPEEWSPLPEGFVDALSFCHFSAGRDAAKPLLTCVHAFGKRREAWVESCDNFRLTRHRIGAFSGDLLLPAAAARTLCRYAPREHGTTEGWAHFRNAVGAVFSARVYEGEYPDLSAFLDVGEGAHEVTLPSDLEGMLERAGVFSSAEFKQDEHVDVTLEGRSMTIRGEGGAGWFEESCPVRWSGRERVTFSIHPELLKQVLGHVDKVLVNEGTGRLRIDGEAFSHVIVLAAGE
jgi:DNA polymerase III sliding clamp (beta) subunit (PCNA family)